MGVPFKTQIDEYGRICTKCGKYKNWENYYTHKGKNGKPKKVSICIECKREYFRDLYKNNKLEKENAIRIMNAPKVKIKEDICPELTPEMFGIEINNDLDDTYY